MLRDPPGSTSSLELVILEDGSPALEKCQSWGGGVMFGVSRGACGWVGSEQCGMVTAALTNIIRVIYLSTVFNYKSCLVGVQADSKNWGWVGNLIAYSIIILSMIINCFAGATFQIIEIT